MAEMAVGRTAQLLADVGTDTDGSAWKDVLVTLNDDFDPILKCFRAVLESLQAL